MTVGTVRDTPELKVSVKGTQYLKFTLEAPQGEGRWAKRVGVTVFGQQAVAIAAQVPTPGYLVSVVGEPQARGYVDKMGKAQGVLELVGREVRVLAGAPVTKTQDASRTWTPPDDNLQPVMAAAATKEPNFGDDDIPF